MLPIYHNSSSNYFISSFREKIYSLLEQEKKIIIIVSIIFGFLAAFYIARHYILRARPSIQEQTEALQQQIAEANQTDHLASLNGWKQGSGKDEEEQTLQDFIKDPMTQFNISRTHLKMVTFGKISSRERQMLEIVADYIQEMHGIETTLDSTSLILDNDNLRHHPHLQYPIEPLLSTLHTLLPEKTFCIGFTNQDLYPYCQADSVNFIFGIGNCEMACGLFSTYRFNTGNFEQTLKRLMKLATHEFAHMRGISHCTSYVCNMEGANSLHEGDQVPLTFCAQDMAKICYLNSWSLKEGYEHQLHFFENFSQHYGKAVNFSIEIDQIKAKINKIKTS